MNNPNSETSFTELRCKEVINACDGRRLGRITDVVFSSDNGRVQGIVTPFARRGMFAKGQEVFIPWSCIKKLGEDVIIVDVRSVSEPRQDALLPSPRRSGDCPPPQPPPYDGGPNCDRRCDKCMLYDCEHRWKSPGR